MISHDAFGLYEDLMDHRVTMVTVHFMDAVLVKLEQRQQHPQGQSLSLLTVTQLHRLDAADPEIRDRKEKYVEQSRTSFLKHHFTLFLLQLLCSHKSMQA